MKQPSIAIVGLGGIFPDAPDLDTFWQNILAGKASAKEAPADRWLLPVDNAFDPEQGKADHVYSKRGCFIDGVIPLNFDALELDADLVRQLDPMYHLLLHAGLRARDDADASNWDHRTTGVIVGNLALPTELSSALARAILGRTFEEKVLGESPDTPMPHLLNRYVTGFPAALLAKALGLGGTAYTLDAACASSLYAIKLAVDELQAGRADVMFAGGVSRPDPLYTQMGFSQLRALSPTGACAPFDQSGNGLVVGEGAGILVLKRLDDALADGNTIHAVIRGIGLSNDVGGRLLAPTSEGQLRAMRAAYDAAGWSPESVGLVECHATGTAVGDAIEVESLKQLWAEAPWTVGQCTLGSVKSNIGHTLTAAGSAAMLKAVLALKHKELPPTANYQRSPDAWQLDQSPFIVRKRPEPWNADGPRRAAVSAFGFGGINAHVLVEEWVASEAEVPAVAEPLEGPECPIAIVGVDAHFGPWQGLEAVRERLLGGGAEVAPQSPSQWHGVEQSAWYRRAGLSRNAFKGYWLGEIAARLDRFRIPPKELEEMLPQQLLMLQVAVNAWEHAGHANYGDETTGVYIGVGLDLNTTNFNVRWSLRNQVKTWLKAQGGETTPEAVERYLAVLRDALTPPLTANRTMGGLASVAASRIARELRCGGPSFTLSGEESSGIRALEAATRALQRGEINQAIVGAVDLAGDVRAVLGTHHHSPFSPTGEGAGLAIGSDGALIGEGALAFVLKRLEDAEAAGDRVVAVIKGIGSAAGGGVDACRSTEAYRHAVVRAAQDGHIELSSIEYVETHGSGVPGEDSVESEALASLFTHKDATTDIQHCLVGTAMNDIGHTGAAAGLAGVLKAALCLQHEILPPLRRVNSPIESLSQGASRLWAPEAPQYWLHDKAAGPRRAGASSMTPGGGYTHVILEEASANASPTIQPLGSRGEALFILTGESASSLLGALDRLKQYTQNTALSGLETIARSWWKHNPVSHPARSIAMVARSISELLEQIEGLRHALTTQPEQGIGGRFQPPRDPAARDRVFYSPDPLGVQGKVAFVFPGSGNHYTGMGRDLFAHWPEILRAQNANNNYLRQQFQPDVFWRGPRDFRDNHKAMIFGQVSLGTAVSDLVRHFGVEPQVAIGYSLGETASLFSLGAWRDRDLMLERIANSRLFTEELAGDCNAARRAWQLPGQEAVDWVLGVIDRPMKVAKQALKQRKKVYPLIANTFQESVIGGNRKAVEKLIAKLECQFIPLEGVTTVHCDVVKEVEKEYRDLHLFNTTPPMGVQFFSGAWGKSYTVTRESAADSVLAQAIDGVDFPAVIESAYEQGARFFIEMGPGNSCSRMISRILVDKPHVARSVCYDGQNAVSLVLRTLGQLVVEGLPVNLDALYGHGESESVSASEKPMVRIAVGGGPFVAPPVPKAEPVYTQAKALAQAKIIDRTDTTDKTDKANLNRSYPSNPPSPSHATHVALSPALLESVALAESAAASAHAQYLHFAETMQQVMAGGIAWQMQLLTQPGIELAPLVVETPVRADVVFDRDQCMEFAIGSIAKMLGPRFAQVDSHPTRVRLPDEPLMLVDRITALEGEPCSMGSGRVVTEHDVLHNGWYLDGGHIPTCVAVEAGQADLFLSGYLGIDFETKGKAMYRLLDAEVTFLDHTPVAGQVIRYDIHIDHFFRHGNPWFFKFWFDATVDGKPLMTMRNGCAGFFTEEDLAAGQGVVDSRLALQNDRGTLPDDWRELAPMAPASYTDAQVNALRVGNLAGCFGNTFAALPLQNPVRIPDGKMNLVHRVLELTPGGGRYGLGRIVAEADIHPDDWFITCHFVDDRVMPGTLMFECCLHTLRIYLMRMGWVAEADAAYWEPRPGVTGKLKCRGQVLETTKKVTYEVNIKEMGYGPQPYAIADARMYADGKAIVDIGSMSIQLQGQTREGLESLWGHAASNDGTPRPAIYTYEQILAFSSGKPSEAFGAPYAIFDPGQARKIARLPRPPYQFLDRVVAVTGTPFVLEAGPTVEAQYDIPADEWYFGANRQTDMPFAVLLEIALQPCGWLAAYCGSALTSEIDLKFRNLGGKAVQHRAVTGATGTITVKVKMTAVSNSGGMIIQHYHMAVHGAEGCLYEGTTYFGFFSQAALADQVGIREAVRYQPTAQELAANAPRPFPTEAPFPDNEWRMLDQVTVHAPTGGPAGLGFVQGTLKVRPDTWFFQAHFFEDPVCPGSLGLESFMQLLKFFAVERWGATATTQVETLALGEDHEWIYRGQIIPTDNEVTVEAVITSIDDERRLIHADGYLIVDGRVIYQMKKFSLRAGTDADSRRG